MAGLPPIGSRPDRRSSASSPVSASRQPRAPQWQIAVRIEGHVPDLAGVSGRAREQSPPDDDPGSDAAVAPDRDEVRRPPARAAKVLGRGGKIGIVANHHGHVEVGEAIENELADRHVLPAQWRGLMQIAILIVDEAGHRNADGHDFGADFHAREQWLHHLVDFVEGLLGSDVHDRPIEPGRGDHLAAQADDGGDPVGGEGQPPALLGHPAAGRRRARAAPAAGERTRVAAAL